VPGRPEVPAPRVGRSPGESLQNLRRLVES